MCAWKQAVNKSNREELRERRKKEKVCEGGLKRTTGRQWKEGKKEEGKEKIKNDNKWRGAEQSTAEWRCTIRSCINLKAYFNETPAGAQEKKKQRWAAHEIRRVSLLGFVFCFLRQSWIPFSLFLTLSMLLHLQSNGFPPHFDVIFKICCRGNKLSNLRVQLVDRDGTLKGLERSQEI